ncbi:hypothetical protein BU23DRAFT_159197 [Bimuria novae-zelandiae CBS 107.79]|uniref:Uncharacterized protein n=1 Tax=Bimuria novae-zelandiae CBS 107.79 TaxID=1447943 RepID=A0A6A5VBT1_9PLEO|nr:hypothetical protein BU23DRAFT_159197 [Bimuria novae-zelandiae CBS 107.79]
MVDIRDFRKGFSDRDDAEKVWRRGLSMWRDANRPPRDNNFTPPPYPQYPSSHGPNYGSHHPSTPGNQSFSNYGSSSGNNSGPLYGPTRNNSFSGDHERHDVNRFDSFRRQSRDDGPDLRERRGSKRGLDRDSNYTSEKRQRTTSVQNNSRHPGYFSGYGDSRAGPGGFNDGSRDLNSERSYDTDSPGPRHSDYRDRDRNWGYGGPSDNPAYRSESRPRVRSGSRFEEHRAHTTRGDNASSQAFRDQSQGLGRGRSGSCGRGRGREYGGHDSSDGDRAEDTEPSPSPNIPD